MDLTCVVRILAEDCGHDLTVRHTCIIICTKNTKAQIKCYTFRPTQTMVSVQIQHQSEPRARLPTHSFLQMTPDCTKSVLICQFFLTYCFYSMFICCLPVPNSLYHQQDHSKAITINNQPCLFSFLIVTIFPSFHF